MRWKEGRTSLLLQQQANILVEPIDKDITPTPIRTMIIAHQQLEVGIGRERMTNALFTPPLPIVVIIIIIIIC
jgi:hypothetical protein